MKRRIFLQALSASIALPLAGCILKSEAKEISISLAGGMFDRPVKLKNNSISGTHSGYLRDQPEEEFQYTVISLDGRYTRGIGSKKEIDSILAEVMIRTQTLANNSNYVMPKSWNNMNKPSFDNKDIAKAINTLAPNSRLG
jgi:hypothetical protein